MTKAKAKNVLTGTNQIVVEDVGHDDGMLTVQTGIDIRDGRPVTMKVSKPVDPKLKWQTEDREVYTAQMNGEGSLNGRRFDFKTGDTLHMNVDEAKLFSNYVTKVTK